MVERLLAKYGNSLRYVGSFEMDEKVAQSVGSQFSCSFCDQKFLKESSVIQHHRKAHSDKLPFTCEHCELKFLDVDSVNIHYELCHGIQRKVRCVICNGRYIKINWHCKKKHNIEFPASGLVDSELEKTVDAFLKHQTDGVSEGLSEQKVFVEEKKERKALLESIRTKYTKLRNARFECLICGRTFSSKGYLAEHRQRHRGLFKPWQCKICHKNFSQSGKNQMISHMALHTGEKPFPCRYCGKRFLHQGDWRNHIQDSHYKRTRDCRICGKPFEYKTFRQHCAQEHAELATQHKPVNPKSRQCKLCGKSFKHSSSLRGHKKFHCNMLTKPVVQQPKNHICEGCGKNFSTADAVARHQKSLDSPVPGKKFQCELGTIEDDEPEVEDGTSSDLHGVTSCDACGKVFSTKYTLERHLKPLVTPAPGTIFQCKTCDKSFPRLACLRNHQHEHNVAMGKVKQKHAQCRFCNRKFTDYSHLLYKHKCLGRLQFERQLAEERLHKSLSSMVTDEEIGDTGDMVMETVNEKDQQGVMKAAELIVASTEDAECKVDEVLLPDQPDHDEIQVDSKVELNYMLQC